VGFESAAAAEKISNSNKSGPKPNNNTPTLQKYALP
jgi:hypothetical protein